MAELGIGHSNPLHGDSALITQLPASRKPAQNGDQEFRAYLSEEAPHFSALRCMCFVECGLSASSSLKSESSTASLLRLHLWDAPNVCKEPFSWSGQASVAKHCVNDGSTLSES